MAGEEPRQYDARLIERNHSGLARKHKVLANRAAFTSAYNRLHT